MARSLDPEAQLCWVYMPLGSDHLSLRTSVSHAISILEGRTIFDAAIARVETLDGKRLELRDLQRILTDSGS